MKQTANYQLSQWDADDHILRTDFNADNAKIDGVLASMERRIGVRLLRNLVTTEAAQIVNVPLTDVDWSQWKTLYFWMWPRLTGGSVFRIGYQAGGSFGTFTIGSYQGSLRMISYPMYSGDEGFNGLVLTSSCEFFQSGHSFQNLDAFSLYAPGTDALLASGTRLVIKGEM